MARKRRKLFFESYADFDAQKKDLEHDAVKPEEHQPPSQDKSDDKAHYDDEPTDVKLARLISLFPDVDEAVLLDVLVSYEGCVEAASACLDARHDSNRSNNNLSSTMAGVLQSSILSSFQSTALNSATVSSPSSSGWSKPLTKRGKTLYLYSPDDIARHTPCSIIHNFLPPEEATALLTELLEEAKTFHAKDTFQLFDKTVQSPHSSKLYVSTDYELRQQAEQYVYNGRYQTDVRKLSSRMKAVSDKVQIAVNEQVRQRIQTHYPNEKKLRYQSPREWVPNVALVNCYDGPQESVGYHSDQQTYLGPRAIIGSLSLGVAREFRVRKVVAREVTGGDDDTSNSSQQQQQQDEYPTKKTRLPDKIADAQGQISIHLPHNSLLVMHAEMQEEWKHSIPAVSTISPHPIAGNKRINVTYRWYRESLHPRNIPRCRCNMPTILRCVQRKQESKGRYMWMCYAGYSPGSKGCSFFQWAEFDDDGEPLWEKMGTKRHRTTNDEL